MMLMSFGKEHKDKNSYFLRMEKIGRKAETDKIIIHGYHRFYEDYLSSFRNEGISMLEIGIQNGNSLKLWKNYFPKAYIYGIDISIDYTDERTTIFKADQSNIDDLNRIVIDIKPRQLHFINDDGSHIPEHQILSFNKFFDELLIEGGIYIIEDIETSYWKRGELYGYSTNYGYCHRLSVIEIFKNMADYINRKYISDFDKKVLREKLKDFSDSTLNAISSITFAQNCIIIKKKLAYEYQYTSENYYYNNLIE
jgi:hypothetical protein